MLLRVRSTKKRPIDLQRHVLDLFDDLGHGKTLQALALAVEGAVKANSLTLHAIGRAQAELRSTTSKNGVNRVDELLRNSKLVVEKFQKRLLEFTLGQRKEVGIAIDWTDFDDDDHTTLFGAVVTNHGRATPAIWKTVKKSTLKGNQKRYERELLEELREMVPDGVHVTILADRGFADVALFQLIESYGWDYVIRLRRGVYIGDGEEIWPVEELVRDDGRTSKYVDYQLTTKNILIPAVVTCRAPRMKDAWILASSKRNAKGSEIVKLYGRRFTIEETFRDQKDLRFGMGLRATHIRRADRRDRLILLVAIAEVLLTLLGAAAEAADMAVKTNTEKRRQLSLYNQGIFYYNCLPTMRDDRKQRLLAAYETILNQHALTRDFLAVV